jgi:hypothetical protein
MPMPSRIWRSRGRLAKEEAASANRAMIPPSPWLFARRISVTYLSETTTVNEQKISETMPTTFLASSGSPLPESNTVFSV